MKNNKMWIRWHSIDFENSEWIRWIINKIKTDSGTERIFIVAFCIFVVGFLLYNIFLRR